MPNYVYKCNEGHRFEKIVPIANREELQQCPVEGCGRIAARDIAAEAPGFTVRGGTPKFYR